jgi:hypothetical protein
MQSSIGQPGAVFGHNGGTLQGVNERRATFAGTDVDLGGQCTVNRTSLRDLKAPCALLSLNSPLNWNEARTDLTEQMPGAGLQSSVALWSPFRKRFATSRTLLPWKSRDRSILKRIGAICSECMQTTLVDSANLFRLVHFFEVLAAVVFAVSGALVASRKGMDVMGFMWFAVITGVGAGTVRDLILNVPVFWVQNPVHVSACLVTAVASRNRA